MHRIALIIIIGLCLACGLTLVLYLKGTTTLIIGLLLLLTVLILLLVMFSTTKIQEYPTRPE